MKNKLATYTTTASLPIAGMLAFLLLLAACKEDENRYTGPITISKVYLQDAQSSVPDREVSFVRLGQLIRIEGSGFTDLKRVYINGFSTYFNPVMVSDGSMLVSVDRNTPIIEAEADVRNTIRLANDGSDASYSIEVRASAPTITGMTHTMPRAGETISMKGTGLLEVHRVVFPGDVEVTEGIVSDEEGEFFSVTVPDGVSAEGGAILVECANGGAYTPAFFNFTPGVILNFDGVGQQGYWGSATSMLTPDDLESASVGTGVSSQGTYVAHRPVRIDSIQANKSRNSEVWTAGNDVDDWRGQLTPYIPAETPVNEVAFQFDMYVPEVWEGTAYLKVCLVNGFNGGEWAGYSYNFVPWVDATGAVVPVQTTGWNTVTIPFSEFYAFKEGDFTFDDVLIARETASWKNFGFYLENTDFNYSNITGNAGDAEVEFPSRATDVKVYTDNWRVVPFYRPEYSDFPDGE